MIPGYEFTFYACYTYGFDPALAVGTCNMRLSFRISFAYFVII